MFTNRDKQYLKAIFLLHGSVNPVGPQVLANKLAVSRVCALQKMRRLEVLGYGDYIRRKGLVLNQNGILVITQDIKKHHILEKFFEDTLKITTQEACDHSSHIGPFICDSLVSDIANNIKSTIKCNCGSCLSATKNSTDLENCHYLNKGFGNGN